eukprot:5291716-Alexandrium_andersonii.AAC.1
MCIRDSPKEVNGVGDHVGDPREGDALALADRAVDEGPPEAPHDAATRESGTPGRRAATGGW